MPIHSILVAFDGTAPAQKALDQAVEIALLTHAKLRLVCVVPPGVAAYGFEVPAGATTAETFDASRQMMADAKAEILKKGVSDVETVLLEGDPVEQIVTQASQQPADLIVIGSRGLSEAGRFFLGSVSDGILHHAHGSILIVKSDATPRPKPLGRPK